MYFFVYFSLFSFVLCWVLLSISVSISSLFSCSFFNTLLYALLLCDIPLSPVYLHVPDCHPNVVSTGPVLRREVVIVTVNSSHFLHTQWPVLVVVKVKTDTDKSGTIRGGNFNPFVNKINWENSSLNYRSVAHYIIRLCVTTCICLELFNFILVNSVFSI